MPLLDVQLSYTRLSSFYFLSYRCTQSSGPYFFNSALVSLIFTCFRGNLLLGDLCLVIFLLILVFLQCLVVFVWLHGGVCGYGYSCGVWGSN